MQKPNTKQGEKLINVNATGYYMLLNLSFYVGCVWKWKLNGGKSILKRTYWNRLNDDKKQQ